MSAGSDRLTPARLRKPSLGEATLHGGWTLFVESFKRYAVSKRAFILAFLFATPSAIILLVRALAPLPQGAEGTVNVDALKHIEWGVILTFAPTVLLSFAALLNSTGLIQDEIEEQTLTYLFLRPTPRWMIYLAKLVAATMTTALIAVVFHALAYVFLYSGTERFGDALGTAMPRSAGALALTAVAYSAFFGLIGLVLKRSLVVGVLYIVIFEGILASIPFNFRAYTIVYHFRVMCFQWLGVDAEVWGMPEPPLPVPTAGGSAAALAVSAVVFAVLAAVYVQYKEFRMKTPAGA
jgi:ABC-2 type transport system permease protein